MPPTVKTYSDYLTWMNESYTKSISVLSKEEFEVLIGFLLLLKE